MTLFSNTLILKLFQWPFSDILKVVSIVYFTGIVKANVKIF